MARPTTGLAYLTLITTILGGFIFTVFVVLPAWSGLETEKQRLATVFQERDEKQAFLANIDVRVEDLKSLEKEVRILRVMFPGTVGSADITALLHSLSVRDGVTVERVTEPQLRPKVPKPVESPPSSGSRLTGGGESTSTVQEGGSVGTVTGQTGTPLGTPYEMTMSVRGTYVQMRAFLLDLERSLRFIDVKAIDLQRDEASATGALLGKVTLRAYVLDDVSDQPGF